MSPPPKAGLHRGEHEKTVVDFDRGGPLAFSDRVCSSFAATFRYDHRMYAPNGRPARGTRLPGQRKPRQVGSMPEGILSDAYAHDLEGPRPPTWCQAPAVGYQGRSVEEQLPQDALPSRAMGVR